jgi:methionyl aminopeptidase
MIELKTPGELERMRRAGRILAGLLEELQRLIRPGLKTKGLDEAARGYLLEHGAQPAFLGYRGFPSAICVSVNEEVVHGIPGNRILREGDLVSLDVGAVVDGLYADSARTVPVGPVSARARRLMETAWLALEAAIQQAVVGHRLSDISHTVQRIVEGRGCGVVRDFVGHGIGRALHEEPPIPNFGPPNTGPRLQAGMVLAIEPMVTLGGYAVEVLEDGWTVRTTDRSLAAHVEDTVAVTESGPDILTRTDSEDAKRRPD